MVSINVIALLFTLLFIQGISSEGDANRNLIHQDLGKKSVQDVHSHGFNAQPRVILAPIVDRSNANVGWSLSQEFTERLYNELTQCSSMNIHKGSHYDNLRKDPFVDPLSWVAKHYPRADFVTFVELVQHDTYAKKPSKVSEETGKTAKLFITFRIRVLDMRATKPKIVLQEIIQKSKVIPLHFAYAANGEKAWGNPQSSLSPLASMHENLSKEMATRIEHYVVQNAL